MNEIKQLPFLLCVLVAVAQCKQVRFKREEGDEQQPDVFKSKDCDF